MKRWLKRIGVVVLVLAGVFGFAAWVILNFVLIRPPSYQPKELVDIKLRPWPEHDAIYQSTGFPYVLSLEYYPGELEYVGSKHTSDAEHPQLKEIESRWNQFKPTVALCEGRARMYRFASRVETGHLSESELVRILAYQNGVTLYTLEPTYSDEVAGLLEKFDAEMVATYMTLRVYASEASSVSKSDQDGLALGLMHKRTDVDGLKQTFKTLEDLDGYWRKTFPDAPDWRTLRDTESIPKLRGVGDLSREIRGQQMVSTIVELVKNGERVFAVVGASHVIRQEPSLTELLAE